MGQSESEQGRFLRINNRFMLALGLIFCATLIALPFSNRVALWIYFLGCLLSVLMSVFEARNRRIVYQLQGPAAASAVVWARTQGGLLGKMTQAINAVFHVMLWPSRFMHLLVYVLYALRRVNDTAFITHIALLIPKFLVHIPILLVLSWMTYNEVRASNYTLLSTIFVAMTTLCAALYMLLIGAASFKAYVSHNLTHPAVNAMLIAIQLGLAILLVVANLLPLARPGAHAFSAAVVQLFNLSELTKNLKQTALTLFAGGSPAPGENLAYGLLVMVIIAGFYATVIKAVLSGLVFGRSDTGRLAAAAYFRTRGNFQQASHFIKGVDNKNPIKQVLLLQVLLARGQVEGSFAAASRLLRLLDAPDSPENQSGMVVTTLAQALAGMDETGSRKDFALDLIAALRARKVHDLFALLALRDLYVIQKLSDEDIDDIKSRLLAAQPDHVLWRHLELITVLRKQVCDFTYDLLVSARGAASPDADFFSRVAFFWPIFGIWNNAAKIEIPPGAPAVEDDLACIQAALKATLDGALAHRYDKTLWEALLLVNFIGTPMEVLAAKDPAGNFVSEEHLAAVDEWVTQLANDGLPGMSDVDLTSMSRDLVS